MRKILRPHASVFWVRDSQPLSTESSLDVHCTSQTLLHTHNETREDSLRRERERERKRKHGRASETATQTLRREDRLRHRRERKRKRRAPETGGTLEKMIELVQSHSQGILSYSPSPA